MRMRVCTRTVQAIFERAKRKGFDTGVVDTVQYSAGGPTDAQGRNGKRKNKNDNGAQNVLRYTLYASIEKNL